MKLLDIQHRIAGSGENAQHYLMIQSRNEDKVRVFWSTSTGVKSPLEEHLKAALTQNNPSLLVINIGKIADRILQNSKDEYTNSEIKDETGLTLRQIQYYTTEKIVTPKRKGSGRGSHHKYSQDNLLDFFVIRELWSYGITIQTIRDIFDQVEFMEKSAKHSYRQLK